MCHARIENGGDSNYHVFLNSVKGISKILRLAKLTPSDARVICSKSENEGKRNQSILPVGFTIASTTDPVKTINFYTSTCFEGQDIYDKNGRSFIVSDGHTQHTKIDISTSLIQICGRIRDSKYKGYITQYYATSKYRNVTLEEFSAAIEKNIEEAEQVAEAMNNFPERYKNKMLEKLELLHEPYITSKEGQITVDRNMANLEKVNYKIVNGDYASYYNMVNALQKSGFIVDQAIEDTADPITLPAPNSAKLKFKDVFEEYCELKTHSSLDIAAYLRMERIMYDKPLVKEAFDKLGAEEVRKLKYKVMDIRRAITVKSRADESVKIVKLVNAKIRKQTPIPSKKVKEVLQGIYKDLGIEGAAKATDLSKWYEIKQTTARIDGISTSCITIIRPHINIGI